jgi:hypothetical protein
MSKLSVGDVFAIKLGRGRGRPARVAVIKNRGIFVDVQTKTGDIHTVKPKDLRAHTATKSLEYRNRV